jgi:hypothetical protein
MKLSLLILVCLLASGCENTPSESSDGLTYQFGSKVVEQSIESNTQVTTIVSIENFINWVKSHPYAHIDALTAIDTKSHGRTSGYIIIWTETSSKIKKVEKTAREIALDKLSESDKLLLNLKETK